MAEQCSFMCPAVSNSIHAIRKPSASMFHFMFYLLKKYLNLVVEYKITVTGFFSDCISDCDESDYQSVM